MNALDVTIIVTLALIALLGVRTGILAPASSLGALALGVVLALRYHWEVEAAVGVYVDDERVLRVTAYASIVLATFLATRIAAYAIRKLLSSLHLGWLDRAAGAAAGLALGAVALGTVLHLLAGVNGVEVQRLFRESALAGPITVVSLVYTPDPWCAEVPQRAPSGCTDLQDLLGAGVSQKLEELLGSDVGTLVEVVEASLSDSTEKLTSLAQGGK